MNQYTINIQLTGECESLAHIIGLLSEQAVATYATWTMTYKGHHGLGSLYSHDRNDIATYLSLVTQYDAALVGLMLEQTYGNISYVKQAFESGYVGHFMNEESLARYHLDKYNLSFCIIEETCIGFRDLGSDLLCTDYHGFRSKEGGLHVFLRSKEAREVSPSRIKLTHKGSD